jgi:hypothetical protein
MGFHKPWAHFQATSRIAWSKKKFKKQENSINQNYFGG